MMIEINKRVYLNDLNKYNNFYNCMMEYYKLLKRIDMHTDFISI